MRLIGLVLAFSLTLLPLAARAQESGKVYKIGWLAGFPLEVQGKTRPGSAVAWRAFTDGLRDLGWVENQNFVFVYRYSEGRPERYPPLHFWTRFSARSCAGVLDIDAQPARGDERRERSPGQRIDPKIGFQRDTSLHG